MIDIVDPRTGELMDTDSVPGLAQVAALQNEQIERLASVVTQMQEPATGAGGDVSKPIVWSQLEPHERTRNWRELADWVGWLRGRYPLARQVPPCWWRHPELVEELTALWLAWKDAYTEKGTPLSGPADWHGRWFPELLRRIGAGGWNIGCEGEHKDVVSGLYDDRSVDDEEAFNRFTSGAGLEGQVSEGTGMEDAAMQSAIDSGEARRLGGLPDSPVSYRDAYWVRGDDGWLEVDDAETVSYLADAERRLRLADEAVGDAGQQ